jgi:hypothetical protein
VRAGKHESVKMKKATSKDWKILPLPKKRSLIPVDRHFTLAEMDRSPAR